MRSHMNIKSVTMHGHMNIKFVTMRGHMNIKFIYVLGKNAVKQFGHCNVSYLKCTPFGHWNINILIRSVGNSGTYTFTVLP
jgi:hypothetical protein